MAEGHRERLRKRAIQDGINNMEDYAVLELILQTTIPRRDVGQIARGLIEYFGGLDRVIEAPYSRLIEFEGVGESAAFAIKAVLLFYRRYAIAKGRVRKQFTSRNEIGAYMKDILAGERDETLYALCVDGLNRLLACRKISSGSFSSVDISMRKIIEFAIETGANGMFIAHNHPSGFALPSQADIDATAQIKSALKKIGVELLDHFIVESVDYVSVADSAQNRFLYDRKI